MATRLQNSDIDPITHTFTLPKMVVMKFILSFAFSKNFLVSATWIWGQEKE